MGAHVFAQHLGLKASRGWVYRDVTLHVDAGALAAITGPAASGRTSLLLTLAGRMKPTTGHAQVGEQVLPHRLHAVQRMVGLGVFHGVNDLDETLRVSDLVREQLALRRRAGHPDGVRSVLGRVGLDVDPHLFARDLRPDQRVLLGAALGLVGDPQVLAVDDLDVGSIADSQRGVWAVLRGVADSGVTVLASCLDPAPGLDAHLLDAVVSIMDPHGLAAAAALPEPDAGADADAEAEAAGVTRLAWARSSRHGAGRRARQLAGRPERGSSAVPADVEV